MGTVINNVLININTIKHMVNSETNTVITLTQLIFLFMLYIPQTPLKM